MRNRFSLKNFVVGTALLALCTFVSQPARAADWSDKHFSCDLELVRTSGMFFEIYLWGVWIEIKATISQTGGTDDMKAAYICTIVGNGPRYNCHLENSNYFASVSQAWKTTHIELEKGVTKSQACERIFSASGTKWWLKGC
jgi:hypothetical protein